MSQDSREVVRRAERLYEQRLKAELEASHLNEYLAIEPDSGDYFLGHTLSEAAQALRKAHPGRQGFVLRVGHPATVYMVGVTRVGPVR